MQPKTKIQYLTRQEIDIEKWNNCITKASNGLIYAYIYYLDAVCSNWDAIVLDDYEAVIPLPWKKKYGIKYVYQAALIQRLGIFGNLSFDVNNLCQELWSRFSFVHYNVSRYIDLPGIQIKKLQNFIINLDRPYEAIRQSYSKDCILNIQKAERRGCRFTNEISVTELINNYRTAYGLKNNGLKDSDYLRFSFLIEEAKKRDAVSLLGVKNEDNLIIYSAAILRDEKRLYYILGAPTKEGRQKRATYFFIDSLLKQNAERSFLFDFEGSDLPNVETFYKKFGPETEFYYEVKASRSFALTCILNFLKRNHLAI